jgi:hypothetical protein
MFYCRTFYVAYFDRETSIGRGKTYKNDFLNFINAPSISKTDLTDFFVNVFEFLDYFMEIKKMGNDVFDTFVVLIHL